MAGTMTNIENNTIRMYWNVLRSMSKNIRLGLAVKLTNSVLEEESKEMSDEAYTEAMFDKFYGALNSAALFFAIYFYILT